MFTCIMVHTSALDLNAFFSRLCNNLILEQLSYSPLLGFSGINLLTFYIFHDVSRKGPQSLTLTNPQYSNNSQK